MLPDCYRPTGLPYAETNKKHKLTGMQSSFIHTFNQRRIMVRFQTRETDLSVM
jgi:hypothetical protein